MKNSILFKFVAILLCAVSLTGIIGGAAGVLVLAEADLYDKTVDQVIDERLQETALLLADRTALAYASRELGGCPDDMAEQRYMIMPDCDYGYVILDAEGNELESRNPGLKEIAQVYEVPVTGQYMHLVSTETESEQQAKETAQRMDLISRGMADSNGESIPNGGMTVNQVIFTTKEGAPIYEAYGDRNESYSTFFYGDDGGARSDSSYDHEPAGHIGFLYYGPDGQLMYHSFLEEWEEPFEALEIYGVMFLSHEGAFHYNLEDPDGVGILTHENGRLLFTGYPAEEAGEEAVEETIPESVPVTVPETVPEMAAETVSETVAETVSQETIAETQAEESAEDPDHAEEAEEEDSESTEEHQEASSASDIPEEEQEDQEEVTEASSVATEPPATIPPETLPPETLPPETVVEETFAEETVPPETEPVLINGKPLEFYQVNRTEFHDGNTGEHTIAKYVYLPMPELTVEVYLDRSTLGDAEFYDVLLLVRQYRNYLLPAIGICLLVFAITVVYLCTAAGRKPKTDDVRASGLNRLPLDLYLGLDIFAGAAIIALGAVAVEELLERDFLLGCTCAVAAAFAVCLLTVAYLFAFIAQCKTPGGYWWRNLLTVRCLFLCLRLLKRLRIWSLEKGLPVLGRALKKIWELALSLAIWFCHLCKKIAHRTVSALGRMCRRIGSGLNRFYSLLPLTWQWLLAGFAIILILLLGFALEVQGAIVAFALFLALILYGSHCFGTLLESTRKMGKGDLNTKVDDKLMVGAFKEFASDLNDLADVAVVAAQKQLKSERMKTELITNVSHDIKTPLTSIINYVDLLQKPHTEEEGAQYLEVLDRQSQRLKKLVEDLMDMSKASTGNMVVEITRVDAVESVNQALGEFADKLERAHLYPVFRHNEDSVPMMADGKLVWRVLSNLLGNAVKYAMPGTRVYLDLNRIDNNVVISLKNISKDELNVDAEELMERFVRGDVSRNTEGSGLGLNIAKSLMELQKGQLQMLVDGDLFKVTLIFPDAE